MKRTIVFLFMVLLFWQSSGYAASKPGYDSSYDFSQLKRLLVLPPDLGAIALSVEEKEELAAVFWAQAKLRGGVTVLHAPKASLAGTGSEPKELSAAGQSVPPFAERYADAVLCATILEYSEGSRYVEASSYTETKYHTSYRYDSKGNLQEYKIPYTVTHTTPAHDQLTLTVKVEFKVLGLPGARPLFWKTDYRYREPGPLAAQSPLNMYKRSLKEFFAQLGKHLQQGQEE